jgi:hypothetical protein
MELFWISNLIEKSGIAGKGVTKNDVFFTLCVIFVATTFAISCNAQRVPDSKIDVTGNWQITISVAEGTITGKGSLSQMGDSVTGWIGPSENDPIRIKGMFRDGKLIITTLPQPGRTVAFDRVELKVNADSLSGPIENGSHGKGTISFIRSK